MGIDYIVDLDCPAKQALGVEGIVNLVKARNRAETVLGYAREGGDNRPPSEITFQVAIRRMDKVETTDVAVQDLLDRAAGLDPHRSACANCPANREAPEGFGCYRSISYPIEVATENFLLSRLPAKLESPAGYMFSAAMNDFGWQGEQAADMRAQGDTFFVAKQPPARSWTGLTINGNQLFHMLFHVGHLGSSHAKMLCLFFGMIAVGDDDEGPPPVEGPLSGNTMQMIEFVNTLAFAAANQLDILIDG